MDWLMIFLIIFYIVSGILIFLLNKRSKGSWKIWKTNRTVSFLMASNLCLILLLGLNDLMKSSGWLMFSLLFLYFFFLACALIYEIRGRKMKKDY